MALKGLPDPSWRNIPPPVFDTEEGWEIYDLPLTDSWEQIIDAHPVNPSPRVSYSSAARTQQPDQVTQGHYSQSQPTNGVSPRIRRIMLTIWTDEWGFHAGAHFSRASGTLLAGLVTMIWLVITGKLEDALNLFVGLF